MSTNAARASPIAYDKATGAFSWAVNRGPRRKGDRAGCKHANGYVYVRWEGKLTLAHRLAWMLVTGAWPTKDIDHINGNRSDNRFANLREVTRSQNLENQRHARTNNKRTGVLGVSRIGACFFAQITSNGKTHYLGSFKNAEEASKAYRAAKAKLHITQERK